VRHCVHHFGRIEADPLTGLSGREQILHRMRSVDVLLLLHGEDAICAEYIPSKLYEYLWMQRPILAVVHLNSQMAEIISGQGHVSIDAENNEVNSSTMKNELSANLERFLDSWQLGGLPDRPQCSPFTTKASTGKLIEWVEIC
jgi:hypothetical protein